MTGLVKPTVGGDYDTWGQILNDALDYLDNKTPAAPSVTASSVAFTPAGGLSSTTVQSALNELDSEKANVASTPTKAQAIGYAIVFGGN